jgi:hypothetical protein
MAIQLHSWPRSSGTRVSWALEELGLPYEYIEVDASKGEQHSARHPALHPLGKIPALVDGDRIFFESTAMLLHLGDPSGESVCSAAYIIVSSVASRSISTPPRAPVGRPGCGRREFMISGK